MADYTIVHADGTVEERDFTPEELAQREADAQQAQVEQAARALTEGNRTTLTDRAQTALRGNRDYLALASPSNAQAAAQVRALTQQNTAVIRLLLGLLDSTD